jgi:hypothetical protein
LARSWWFLGFLVSVAIALARFTSSLPFKPAAAIGYAAKRGKARPSPGSGESQHYYFHLLDAVIGLAYAIIRIDD